MRKRELLEILNRALLDAQVERASFSQLHSKGPFPTTEAEVTAFIRERTRIYRESWIIAPLKSAIKLVAQDGKPRKPAEPKATGGSEGELKGLA